VSILYERVTSAALPDWNAFQIARHKINYGNLNDLQEGLRLGINKNFTDIKKLFKGDLTAGKAATLMGATLSLHSVETLQDNDELIPSSKQVYEAIKEGLFGAIGLIRLPVDGNEWNEDSLEVPGSMIFNELEHTFQFLGDLGNLHEIGQNLEEVFYNNLLTIVAGQPMTWAGYSSGNKIVQNARCNDSDYCEMIIVSAQNVGTETVGIFKTFGEIAVGDLTPLLQENDDSIITPNTKLYLSTEGGKYTVTKPSRPNIPIWVATVLEYDNVAKEGKIFVFPQKMKEVENALYIEETSPANGFGIDKDVWITKG